MATAEQTPFFDIARASRSYGPAAAGRPPKKVLSPSHGARVDWLAPGSQSWQVDLGHRADTLDVTNIAAIMEPPTTVPKVTPFPLEVPRLADAWRYKFITAADPVVPPAEARAAIAASKRARRRPRGEAQAVAARTGFLAHVDPWARADREVVLNALARARGPAPAKRRPARKAHHKPLARPGHEVEKESAAEQALSKLDRVERVHAWDNLDRHKLRVLPQSAWRDWVDALVDAMELWAALNLELKNTTQAGRGTKDKIFLLTRRLALLTEQLAIIQYSVCRESWTYGVRLSVVAEREAELADVKRRHIQQYVMTLMPTEQIRRAERVMFIEPDTSIE
jgi:hypothetical protein